MKTRLDLAAMKSLVRRLAAVFEENASHLNELDMKAGDGDHGRSMSMGFNAIRDWQEGGNPASIGQLLTEGGSRFNKAAGSTIGILMFQALRKAGKSVGEVEAIDASDFAVILEAMVTAIRTTGKAEVGQRTILDSLVPVQELIANGACSSPEEIRATIRKAIQVAAEGAETTRTMSPCVGRARWFAERSLGEIDPGAVSGALMVEVVGNFLLEGEP